VEYKCELRDPILAAAICKKLGAVRAVTVTQTETYFRVPEGRLKRRVSATSQGDEPVEWLFYHRENRAQPKISRFTIYSDEQAKQRFGVRPIPEWVVVRKRRQVWVVGALRVHIDDVDELGEFLEVEALVSPVQHVAACHKQIRKIITALAPALGESISCGYCDLLAAEQATA